MRGRSRESLRVSKRVAGGARNGWGAGAVGAGEHLDGDRDVREYELKRRGEQEGRGGDHRVRALAVSAVWMALAVSVTRRACTMVQVSGTINGIAAGYIIFYYSGWYGVEN